MPFETADERINRQGRPVGSSNLIRQKIKDYWNDNIDTFLLEVKAMKASKLKREIQLELLKMVLPKQREVQADLEVHHRLVEVKPTIIGGSDIPPLASSESEIVL